MDISAKLFRLGIWVGNTAQKSRPSLETLWAVLFCKKQLNNIKIITMLLLITLSYKKFPQKDQSMDFYKNV
jgi:hypothetical protein